MYKTNIDCIETEYFKGKMVASMRPFKEKDAILASKITKQFPNVHGGPIHYGSGKEIGIEGFLISLHRISIMRVKQ